VGRVLGSLKRATALWKIRAFFVRPLNPEDWNALIEEGGGVGEAADGDGEVGDGDGEVGDGDGEVGDGEVGDGEVGDGADGAVTLTFIETVLSSGDPVWGTAIMTVTVYVPGVR
jgi:hypothetical protein